jgi:hypothetical protein
VSHDGQWHSPTHGPMVAASTDVPQCSQKGWGASPGGRAPRVAGLRAASIAGLGHVRTNWVPVRSPGRPPDEGAIPSMARDKSRGRLPKEPASKLSR